MLFDHGNGADDKYRRQSNHCENTGAHDVAGLAIPFLPVRLNASDGLNAPPRFQGRADHENPKRDKGFYG
jgi:hypothetical protein